MELSFEYASVDDWWDARLDLSPDLTKAIGELSPEERDELTEELTEQLAPWAQPDGS